MQRELLTTDEDLRNRVTRDNFVDKFLSIKSVLIQRGVETSIVTSHDIRGNTQRTSIRIRVASKETQVILDVLKKAGISIQQYESSQKLTDVIYSMFQLFAISHGVELFNSNKTEIIIFEGLALTNAQFSNVEIRN
jgi:hypothetical protein